MIDLSDDTLPKAVMQPLADRLSRVIHSRPMTGRLLYEVQREVDDWVVGARKQGYKVPKMVVVFFETVGLVEIVRADLEHAGIQRVVQNVIRKCQALKLVITGEALAASIHRAFPKYHPDDAQIEQERVLNVLAAGPVNKRWRN